jgi:hypothetical protein
MKRKLEAFGASFGFHRVVPAEAFRNLKVGLKMIVRSSVKDEITASKEETMTTSCATYCIEKVILEHERDELVATVQFDAPQAGQFTYHVFRNGEQIHTQAYSPNPTFRAGIKVEPGLYRVLVHFLDPNGNTAKKYSNPVFLYPVVSAGRLLEVPGALLCWKRAAAALCHVECSDTQKRATAPGIQPVDLGRKEEVSWACTLCGRPYS